MGRSLAALAVLFAPCAASAPAQVFDLAAFVERLALSAWPGGGWTFVDSLPSPRSGHKGGFCTQSFFPNAGEVWSTAGITNPSPTFTNTNQYLAAEACPAVANPVALAVDPGGNGVLEPDETAAVVAPTWRNAGEASIPALTGTASNFTGPSGPTYTLDDGTSNYGAVAVGATASCTATGDCYAVTVGGARPGTHWDGTVNEVPEIVVVVEGPILSKSSVKYSKPNREPH